MPSPRPDTPLEVVQVIASIEAAAAGPSYSVWRLAQAMAQGPHGDHVTLMSLGEPSESRDGGLRHRRLAKDGPPIPGWRRLNGSMSMARALREAATTADIIHGHGLWLLPNIYPANAARRGNVPFVISPRGMLAPSALHYSRFVKRAMWTLLQGRAARTAQALHATSEQECLDIRAAGLRQPVAVIPIGIDLPPATALRTNDKRRDVLFLGRLHPIKGLDDLLGAWRTLTARHPAWHLRIAGPGDPTYVARLTAQASKLDRVSVEGGLYGEAKARAMAEAGLFILPSHGENFAVAVAEALAHGTPVIATRGTPWQRLVDEQCGWWIDQGPAGLAGALDQAMARSLDDLATMGLAGRRWMEREFGWDRIAADTRDVYVWLRRGGAPPACLRMS